MNSKVKGIITPFATILIMIVLGIVIAVIVESGSNDGWAALGAIIIVFLLAGLIMIIELIVGIVLYTRKQSDFALGLIYGVSGIILAGVIFSIFSTVYNSFV
jgi:small-conductance mechanosensitive channel